MVTYNKYPNLTSPIVIGNVMLKNRMYAAPSQPDIGQGGEPYPTSQTMQLMANRARSGASIVTCTGMVPRPAIPDETEHFAHFDLQNEGCQNYISQLSEAIHLYGALASMQVGSGIVPGYDASAGMESHTVEGDGSQAMIGKEIPYEKMLEVVENYANEAYMLKRCGFDMIFVHCAYRSHLPSRFLSPLTNKRTDEFGGDIADRAKFLFMICDRVHEVCGKDFLIEASVSAFEPEGGNTLEDMVRFAKLAEGHLDIIQVRGPEIDPSHVLAFSPERTPYLYCAEAMKKSGTSVKIAAINGFHDPEDCEKALAEGKADMIAMARSWICDPEYGIKVYEGRSEDIVPCLRCNKCHISSWNDPFISTCAVNPRWGFEDKLDYLINEPGAPEKVAVIGGGPAGMEAAIIAAKRGHDVTLFEKSDRLGGLMNHSENVDFKWTMKDFRDYMIRETKKSTAKIMLNTEVTPELLKGSDFNKIIVAIGGEPILPRIPGLSRDNSIFAIEAFYDPGRAGDTAVIIGGGEIGVEAGIYLARQGKKVTVIEMKDRLADDATPVHYRTMFRDVWESQEGFSSITGVRCTGVSGTTVEYEDKEGNKGSVTADTIVVAAGMKPKRDEAMSFYGVSAPCQVIGDCRKVANLQKALRAAYITASF